MYKQNNLIDEAIKIMEREALELEKELLVVKKEVKKEDKHETRKH